MEDLGSWAMPLLLLPGVALLILSTSMRYGELHSELHADAQTRKALSAQTLQGLLKRGRLFRDALVCLYTSFALLSLAGLVGHASSGGYEMWTAVTAGISCTGIAVLTFATFKLIRESLMSFDILKEHAGVLENEPEP